MRTVCVTVNEGDEPSDRMGGMRGDRPTGAMSLSMTKKHFAERGVQAQFFHGIDAAKLGIHTKNPYLIDGPPPAGEPPYKVGPKVVGCWLSHRALWAALLLLPDEHVLVLEDDALFPPGWQRRFDQAMADVPAGFDLLFVGSCCTADKPKSLVRGEVWDVRYPFCGHGYVVAKKALPVLIKTQDAATCYAPIDVSMAIHSLPNLRAYTVLPRILDQYATKIPV
jgi:GR25 family glycosyltransferase involved in LPS biosynthesis